MSDPFAGRFGPRDYLTEPRYVDVSEHIGVAYDAVQIALENLLESVNSKRVCLFDKKIVDNIALDVARHVSDFGRDDGIKDIAVLLGISKVASGMLRDVLSDILHRAKHGEIAVEVRRPRVTKIDVVYEAPDPPTTTRPGRRGPVPPDVKKEIAELAQAGVSLADLSAQYGYPQADLTKILKSAGVKVAPALSAPPVAASPEVRRLCASGIDQDLELEIADALLKGESTAEIAARTKVPPEQVEAVRTAWKVSSPTETVAALVAGAQAQDDESVDESTYEDVERHKRKPPIRIVSSEDDLTRLGEELIFDGGEFGVRVEVPPDLSKKIAKAFDALRTMATRRGGVTEYELLFTNVRRYAERDMPKTAENRYKSFGWKRTTIHELKGFQARLFFATYTSVYPDGRRIDRVGLLHCIVKKRNDTEDRDLDRAAALEKYWLTWREAQDALISAEMKRSKGGRRR